MNNKKAIAHIQSFFTLFEIAPINRVVIKEALELKFPDFEDAVLYGAACHAGALYIVTRNAAGFGKSKIPVFSLNEFINMLSPLEK